MRDRTIRITERELTWLAETSARAWQRRAEREELQGLLAEYLREELLAREARALELDRDDTVVRRRLAQKMSFILEDTARLASPTDADLRARFDADQARFRTPATSSFRQVYFSTDKRGDRATTRCAPCARAAGARRRNSRSGCARRCVAAAARRSTDADEQTIANQFGADFARAVAAIAPGAWQGPIESEFGAASGAGHGARRRPAREPSRRCERELLEEWRREQDTAAKNAYFAGLLRKYDVQATASAQHAARSRAGSAQGR